MASQEQLIKLSILNRMFLSAKMSYFLMYQKKPLLSVAKFVPKLVTEVMTTWRP